MSITITGENLEDVRSKLGRDGPWSHIKIRLRKGEPYDYTHSLEQGCIVNAVGLPGQEVERSFKSASEALRYLRSLLMAVDAQARKDKKERDKKLREQAKKAK